VNIGIPCTLTVYDLLKDMGGVIGGLLAFMAGLLAYSAGRAQAKAVREQNRQLKCETKRHLAHEVIVATRLIDGVLSRIDTDISRLNSLIDQPQYKAEQATIPASWKSLIRRPSIAVVWDKLGLCGQDTIKPYLNLEAELEEFQKNNVLGAKFNKEKLQKCSDIVNSLRGFLDAQGKEAHSTILETESEKDVSQRAWSQKILNFWTRKRRAVP
jgi:hypothetical protein